MDKSVSQYKPASQYELLVLGSVLCVSVARKVSMTHVRIYQVEAPSLHNDNPEVTNMYMEHTSPHPSHCYYGFCVCTRK